jgi:carbamoyl-phosphate synthase small subunit
MSQDKRMLLILEDGTRFEGVSFGAVDEICGWIHCDHNVVGYQEILTDPDNKGCIINMTYPLVGNYGVNDEDNESDGAYAAALIIKERSKLISNWRAKASLDDFMIRAHIVGLEKLDTRSLALHIRNHGELKGIIAPIEAPVDKLKAKLKTHIYPPSIKLMESLTHQGKVPKSFSRNDQYHVAIYDLGIKRSYLKQIEACDCQVICVSANTPWEDITAIKPDGLLISNGYGSPWELGKIVDQIRVALGKLPIFGISLGCQLLALAGGAKVTRMKIGHHGSNYPIRHMHDGRALITKQNHSFVIEKNSLEGSAFQASFINLNDATVEGIVSEEQLAIGIQFSPVPSDEGEPDFVFRHFTRMMDEFKKQ